MSKPGIPSPSTYSPTCNRVRNNIWFDMKNLPPKLFAGQAARLGLLQEVDLVPGGAAAVLAGGPHPKRGESGIEEGGGGAGEPHPRPRQQDALGGVAGAGRAAQRAATPGLLCIAVQCTAVVQTCHTGALPGHGPGERDTPGRPGDPGRGGQPANRNGLKKRIVLMIRTTSGRSVMTRSSGARSRVATR